MERKPLWGKILAATLVVILALTASVTAFADPVVTPTGERPYEIAVAYDNSGSMYGSTGEWCYAKYAMEIFASMMDLTGRDKLTVFTMQNVTIDGGGKTKRIEVKSVADIDKIHKMSTDSLGGTPFTPVTEAYQYLQACDPNNEKERWLIVLTDGAFDGTSGPVLQGKLEAMADGTNINVQYIPFGGTVLSDNNSGDAFHASPNITGKDALRDELVSVCNKIFERDELKNRLSGQVLNLDLSMKRLIVFVQGPDASVLSLKDSNGASVSVLMDSGKRSYSKYSVGNNTLQIPSDVQGQTGQVVTFGACAKGTYTLEYSNADTIQIFYEPDVTMEIEYINADGVVEDFSDKKVSPGEYTFKAKLIDRITGEDVSNHELLGGNVTMDASITYPGEDPINLKSGDKVELKPGDGVTFSVVATYLDRYTITDKDCPDLPDLSNITVENPEPPLSIEAEVQQDDSWYVLKDHDQWKPIRLNLKMDGQPLTDEQLEHATVTVSVDGEPIEFHTELLKGESAVNVYLGVDENGNYVEPAVGDYTLKASAKAYSIYGKELQTKDDAEAEFHVDAKTKSARAWEIFWWILLAVLVVIVLGLIIYSIPAMPKVEMMSVSGEGTIHEQRRPFKRIDGTQKSVKSHNDPDITVFSFTVSRPKKYCWKCSWVKSRLLGRAVPVKFVITYVNPVLGVKGIEAQEVMDSDTKSFDVTWIEAVNKNVQVKASAEVRVVGRD